MSINIQKGNIYSANIQLQIISVGKLTNFIIIRKTKNKELKQKLTKTCPVRLRIPPPAEA